MKHYVIKRDDNKFVANRSYAENPQEALIFPEHEAKIEVKTAEEAAGGELTLMRVIPIVDEYLGVRLIAPDGRTEFYPPTVKNGRVFMARLIQLTDFTQIVHFTRNFLVKHGVDNAHVLGEEDCIEAAHKRTIELRNFARTGFGYATQVLAEKLDKAEAERRADQQS